MLKKDYKYFFLKLLFLYFLFMIWYFQPISKIIEQEKVEQYYQEEEDVSSSPFLAVLEIDRINLKKGIYPINSNLNTVSKNIQLIEGSTYPDEKNHAFILAAHSGHSAISYFKNLENLELGDLAYIDYKNKNYTYQYVKMYQEIKDGTIPIYREENKSYLFLITCDKKNKSLQDVYVFQMLFPS